jgi:VanZ family protein
MVLLTLTHLPRLGPIPEIPGKDKTLHFLAYAVAAGLMLLAYAGRYRVRTVGLIVIGLLALGAIDEITQPYVNRSCDMFDWLADGAGVFCVTGLMVGLQRFRKSER